MAAFSHWSFLLSFIFQNHIQDKTFGEEEEEALIIIPKDKEELYIHVN